MGHFCGLFFGSVALIALAWAKLALTSNTLACCFPAERWMVSATLASVLLLTVPLPLFPPFWWFIGALFINIGVTSIALADTLHFRFFGDVLSVRQVAAIWQLPSVSASIIAALQLRDAGYFADVIVALLALPKMRRLSAGLPYRRDGQVKRFAAGILLTTIIVAGPSVWLIGRDPEEVFEYFIGKRQVVAAIGLLPYHFYDFANYFSDSVLGKMRIGDLQRQRVQHYVTELQRKQELSPSPLAAIAKGRNLVVIQAESLQAFPIGLKVLGQEITPRLSAFAKESLHYTNFYDQTYGGATADGEFTVLQSLHPLSAGAVATRYHTNQYYGLPAILAAAGYQTFAAIGASGEFWNMREMHRRLGFQRSYFEPNYGEGERFGQGLADSDFFDQTLPTLVSEREPFFAFLITVSNHHPYNLPKEHRVLRLGKIEGTLVGDYLHSVHYFDDAFGRFMDGMQKAGLLDKSVIVVYGDHQGWLRDSPDLAQILNFSNDVQYRQWETRKKLPLLIRLPRAEHAGERTVAGGHLDVAPTLLSLLGIFARDRVMLGRDLTTEQGGLVVFRDASFANGRHYFINGGSGRLSSECREVTTRRPMDCESLEAERQSARERLEISDLIIQGNLIPSRDSALASQSFWISELPRPQAFSKELGLKYVNVKQANLEAHPPSGAAFTVNTHGGKAKLFFTPSFNSAVPRDKTDGVTFQVWRNGQILYDKHHLAIQTVLPVQIEIADEHDRKPLKLSFVTLPGPKGDASYDWAVWRNVGIEVGNYR